MHMPQSRHIASRKLFALSSLLVLIVTTADPFPLNAANVHFVPGDSLFHFLLTKQVALESENAKLLLRYQQPITPNGGDFDGYVGFASLEVLGDTRALRKGLRVAYDLYRQDTPREVRLTDEDKPERHEEEINPFHGFVYPRDVNFRSTPIGLKFNEEWMRVDEKPNAPPFIVDPVRNNGGVDLSNRRYSSFVPGETAILTDWRLSTTVAPLRAKVPMDIAWWGMGKMLEHPSLTIDFSEIIVVVVPHGELNALFDRTEWASFMVIHGDGKVDHWRYDESGKLRKIEMNPK